MPPCTRCASPTNRGDVPSCQVGGVVHKRRGQLSDVGYLMQGLTEPERKVIGVGMQLGPRMARWLHP